MRLTIRPPGVNTQEFILGDDVVRLVPPSQNLAQGAPGGIQDGFLLKQERLVQTAAGVRALYQFLAPGFNLKNSLSFIVKRTFTTWELSLAFIALHPDSIPAQGEITMTHQSAAGLTRRFLPNAILQLAECVKHTGVTVHFHYTFVASNPWQNAP